MAMSRFEHDHPTHNMDRTEVEKAEERHVEYGGADNDPAIHTPKEHDLSVGDYLHKGTSFEKKVLRKIDWRLVPVLCKSERITRTTVADQQHSCMPVRSLIEPIYRESIHTDSEMELMVRNARLAGMDRALGTNIGDRYSIITLLCELTAS